MMLKPIFLIGFMGAGKSTLGRGLASCYPSLTYIDLDDVIEEREGMPVGEIFACRGEDYFRRRESELLREVSSGRDVIVGCGGGTPCHSGNMEWMNACGVTVLLQASLPVLLRRLLDAQASRPMISGLSEKELERFIVTKQTERAPYYNRAMFRFCSDSLETADEIRDSSLDFYTRFLNENFKVGEDAAR